MSGRAPDPRTAASTVLQLGDARVDIRAAVSFRTRTVNDGVGLYLSLYDDEIDRRADEFWSAWQGDAERQREPNHLELTDAVMIASPDGEIRVARGAACTFPLYWQADRDLRLSTSLPTNTGGLLSKAGLVTAAAAACLHGSYEPNGFTETPFSSWRRIRRGAVSVFCDKRLTEIPILGNAENSGALDAIESQVRSSFETYGLSQQHVRHSVLELSGGFDSTLAAVMISPRHQMQGVSVDYPYYEFRFERGVQEAVAAHLGISRAQLDGLSMFPYAPSDIPARFDEPSVFVTGIRHAEQVACFARAHGAERIYSGHGGDQCFTTDLSGREQIVLNPPSRGPFTQQAWQIVHRAIDQTCQSEWSTRALGSFVYDARQDVWLKETFGVTLRTPFTDLRIFRSAQAWSRWCKAHDMRPDKSILAQALGDVLPAALLERKGKVAYDGVWMRGYAQQGDHIASTFERTADVLSEIGISAAWLIKRARALANWEPASDREVLAVYAIATWLINWGLDRRRDLAWARD